MLLFYLDAQAAVISKFPAFSGVRNSLMRHRTATNIPVPNPCDIPDELRTTLQGKSVESKDANFQERFLLYSGQNGKLLIFNADTELVILYKTSCFIPRGWDILRQPPVVTDASLRPKMEAFSAYFERTWMVGTFLMDLWSHFDNIGPRTTNLAEGWHNQLNHSFGMPHPSMRNFLHWLQKCQFGVQCRKIQLDAGREAKKRPATYRRLDVKIAEAKLQLNLRCGRIFMQVFPHPSYTYLLDSEIVQYLRYVCYLIVGQ